MILARSASNRSRLSGKNCSDSLIHHLAFGRWCGYKMPRPGRSINQAAVAVCLLTHEGMLAMSKLSLLFAFLVVATGLWCGGCRSCSTCHDYDPPVANCACNACGCNRAGSAYCSCASEVQPADGDVEEYYAAEPATDAVNTATEVMDGGTDQ
jgi:hypothetical protein